MALLHHGFKVKDLDFYPAENGEPLKDFQPGDGVIDRSLRESYGGCNRGMDG